MKQYLETLKSILENGTRQSNRTGIDTIATFGNMMKFDLREGFPIVTTKRTWFKGCKYELKWFLMGGDEETNSMNVKYLQDNNVHIWDEWADADGELGPVYGAQWRAWSWTECDEDHVPWNYSIDQLQEAVNKIRNNPQDRRIIVTAWHVDQIKDMKLPPCHIFYQFNVDGDFLDVCVYQRSADMFLGVPFDIAEYALLLEIMAKITGKTARILTYVFGNTHIYVNHLDQVNELLQREPKPLPKLVFENDLKELDDFDPEKCRLEGYDPWPAIKAEVAV